MRLTKESSYALDGLVFLAAHSRGEAVPLAEIARVQRLPSSFLAKTFQNLVRHGVLTAAPGPGRGYALQRDPAALRVREILEAVEGSDVFERCLFWSGHCGDHSPCPLHYRFRTLRPVIGSLLDAITLSEYARRARPRRHRPVVLKEESPSRRSRREYDGGAPVPARRNGGMGREERDAAP
jgi:Rrf2 family protein